MQCTQCKSKEFKTSTVIADEGDVERTVCAQEACQFIMREVLIVEKEDGTKQHRPRRVKPEDQPEGFGSDGAPVPEADPLLSAEAMMLLAIRTQEETVGKLSRDIAKSILDECAQNVLKGEHTYLIEEKNSTPGAVISQVVQELKDRGYKIKKSATPGKGTEINVKWATKKTPNKRKSRKAALDAPAIQVVGKKELTPKQQKQAAERAKRKAALRARSE